MRERSRERPLTEGMERALVARMAADASDEHMKWVMRDLLAVGQPDKEFWRDASDGDVTTRIVTDYGIDPMLIGDRAADRAWAQQAQPWDVLSAYVMADWWEMLSEPSADRLKRNLKELFDEWGINRDDELRLPSFGREDLHRIKVCGRENNLGLSELIDEAVVEARERKVVETRSWQPLLRFGRRRYSTEMRATTDLGPFGAEVVAQGRVPHVDCASITKIPSPAKVAERLGIPDDALVVRRENWYFADDRPVQIGVTFAPWGLVEGTPVADSADMGPSGIYGQFDAHGHVLTHMREQITARQPTPDESHHLELPPFCPVLDVWHTSLDADHQPFEVTNFVMRGDLTVLDYDIPVED